MAYNPYNSASKIVELKQKWNNAKAKGEDTKVYEQEAVNYYNDLRDNGRSDVADYLQKNDAVTASGYLKVLSPDYGASAEGVQSKSDKQYNDNNNYAQQVNKDYDMVYQTIGVTPTRTQYGQDILKGYGIAADQAYKGALGGGSADNGGNVDSYAAANANRQKAAVVSQGYGDVLDYYNSIAGNALTWAGDKANAVGSFAKLNQDNIKSDREVIMNQDDNSTVRYQSDNTLEGTKYTADKGLEGTKYNADTNLEGVKVNANADMYGYYVDGYNRVVTDALGNQKVVGNGTPAPNYVSLGSNGATGVEGSGVVNVGGNVGADTTGTGTETPVEGTTVTEDPMKVITHNMDDDKYYNGNGDEVTKDGKVKVYFDKLAMKYYTLGGNEVEPSVALGADHVIVDKNSTDYASEIISSGSSRVLADGTIVDSHGKKVGKFKKVGTGTGTGTDKNTTVTKADTEAVTNVIRGNSVYQDIIKNAKALKTDDDKAEYIIQLNGKGLSDDVAISLFSDLGIDIDKYIEQE